jgi:uncharacterized surface anchored protein
VAPTTTPAPTPTPEPAPPGSLAIVTVDADGDPLGLEGACYTVTGATDLAPVCDGDPDDADPAAGTVRLDGLATGAYTVAQTRAPDGFVVAATASVAVAPAAVTEVDLVNLPAPAETGSLVVAATGPGGDPIGGGCYRLVGADGETVAEACDNDRSDTRNDPGRVAFAGLAAGAYTVTRRGRRRGSPKPRSGRSR